VLAIQSLKAGLLICLVVVQTAVAQDDPATDLPQVRIDQFLPVSSPRLSVARFEPMHRPTGVAQPFFLIGTDAYSLSWLRQNLARLLELNAFGLLVAVSNAAAYRQVEAAAVGLVIRPVPGDLLAEHLDIEHYPALITAEGIFP
jgi:integrating conjugative element protein (TIGR03765 family)